MAKCTLYGDSRSGNCYKPALLMRLTGQSFDWVETNVMSGQTRSAEFLLLNANGKVPLLQYPDGRCLAESNAMLLHLARDTNWFPLDEWQQALTWQWLFFEQYSHEPYIAVARFIVFFQGRATSEADRLVVLRERGYQALAVMEKTLQQAPFLTGDTPTVADIALYAYTHVADEGGFDLSSFPAILRWMECLQLIPGWLKMSEACR
ncbi:MAG TPA: glutathione S-transferase family protein [Xanthomonadales bacterium]|nr:glutathione S-transferase family protein [Xanthomonadales bacterium]